MRQTLKKAEILRGKENFRDIFEHGRRCDCKFLRCYYIITEQTNITFSEATAAVAGFAVSRQYSRAVDRNRIKRLMRESYRIHKHDLIDKCRKRILSIQAVFLYAPSVDKLKLPSLTELDIMMETVIGSINLMANR